MNLRELERIHGDLLTDMQALTQQRDPDDLVRLTAKRDKLNSLLKAIAAYMKILSTEQ